MAIASALRKLLVTPFTSRHQGHSRGRARKRLIPGGYDDGQLERRVDDDLTLDWNGDGVRDIASFNDATGVWSIYVSGQIETVVYGGVGNLPAAH